MTEVFRTHVRCVDASGGRYVQCTNPFKYDYECISCQSPDCNQKLLGVLDNERDTSLVVIVVIDAMWAPTALAALDPTFVPDPSDKRIGLYDRDVMKVEEEFMFKPHCTL